MDESYLNATTSNHIWITAALKQSSTARLLMSSLSTVDIYVDMQLTSAIIGFKVGKVTLLPEM